MVPTLVLARLIGTNVEKIKPDLSINRVKVWQMRVLGFNSILSSATTGKELVEPAGLPCDCDESPLRRHSNYLSTFTVRAICCSIPCSATFAIRGTDNHPVERLVMFQSNGYLSFQPLAIPNLSSNGWASVKFL